MTLLAAILLFAAQGDSPKEHTETVGGSTHSYKLTLGGVADAASTRNPIGYSAPIQWFEPMRSVRLENIVGNWSFWFLKLLNNSYFFFSKTAANSLSLFS